MELSELGLLCEPVTPPYVEPISPERSETDHEFKPVDQTESVLFLSSSMRTDTTVYQNSFNSELFSHMSVIPVSDSKTHGDLRISSEWNKPISNHFSKPFSDSTFQETSTQEIAQVSPSVENVENIACLKTGFERSVDLNVNINLVTDNLQCNSYRELYGEGNSIKSLAFSPCHDLKVKTKLHSRQSCIKKFGDADCVNNSEFKDRLSDPPRHQDFLKNSLYKPEVDERKMHEFVTCTDGVDLYSKCLTNRSLEVSSPINPNKSNRKYFCGNLVSPSEDENYDDSNVVCNKFSKSSPNQRLFETRNDCVQYNKDTCSTVPLPSSSSASLRKSKRTHFTDLREVLDSCKRKNQIPRENHYVLSHPELSYKSDCRLNYYSDLEYKSKMRHGGGRGESFAASSHYEDFDSKCHLDHHRNIEPIDDHSPTSEMNNYLNYICSDESCPKVFPDYLNCFNNYNKGHKFCSSQKTKVTNLSDHYADNILVKINHSPHCHNKNDDIQIEKLSGFNERDQRRIVISSRSDVVVSCSKSRSQGSSTESMSFDLDVKQHDSSNISHKDIYNPHCGNYNEYLGDIQRWPVRQRYGKDGNSIRIFDPNQCISANDTDQEIEEESVRELEGMDDSSMLDIQNKSRKTKKMTDWECHSPSGDSVNIKIKINDGKKERSIKKSKKKRHKKHRHDYDVEAVSSYENIGEMIKSDNRKPIHHESQFLANDDQDIKSSTKADCDSPVCTDYFDENSEGSINEHVLDSWVTRNGLYDLSHQRNDKLYIVPPAGDGDQVQSEVDNNVNDKFNHRHDYNASNQLQLINNSMDPTESYDVSCEHAGDGIKVRSDEPNIIVPKSHESVHNDGYKQIINGNFGGCATNPEQNIEDNICANASNNNNFVNSIEIHRSKYGKEECNENFMDADKRNRDVGWCNFDSTNNEKNEDSEKLILEDDIIPKANTNLLMSGDYKSERSCDDCYTHNCTGAHTNGHDGSDCDNFSIKSGGDNSINNHDNNNNSSVILGWTDIEHCNGLNDNRNAISDNAGHNVCSPVEDGENVHQDDTESCYTPIDNNNSDEPYSHSMTKGDTQLKDFSNDSMEKGNRNQFYDDLKASSYTPTTNTEHIPGLSPIDDGSPQGAYTPSSQPPSLLGGSSPISPISSPRCVTPPSIFGLPDLMQLLVQALSSHSAVGDNSNNSNLSGAGKCNDLLQQLLSRFQSLYKPSLGQLSSGPNGLMNLSTNPLFSSPFLIQSQKAINPAIFHYLNLQSLSALSRSTLCGLDYEGLNKINETTKVSYSPFDVNTVSPRSEDAMSFSPPSLVGGHNDDRHNVQNADRKSLDGGLKSTGNDVGSSITRITAQSKADLQQKLVSDIKEILRPVFKKGKINKDDYKSILRKSVPKILKTHKLSYNKEKIARFIEAYIQKVIATRKYYSKKVATVT